MNKMPTLDQPSIDDLVTRVDALLQGRHGRLIGFIASGPGEGTSTLAEAYVAAASTRFRRSVLLLRASGEAGRGGVLPALAAGEPIDELVRPLATGGFVGSLAGADTGGALWELMTHEALWNDLRSHYDEIVLDLPSASASRLGLAVAGHCDGVVVVVEAEKTRGPVAEHLVSSLRAVRANVLGTVLNKRQFHLPEAIYRRL